MLSAVALYRNVNITTQYLAADVRAHHERIIMTYMTIPATLPAHDAEILSQLGIDGDYFFEVYENTAGGLNNYEIHWNDDDSSGTFYVTVNDETMVFTSFDTFTRIDSDTLSLVHTSGDTGVPTDLESIRSVAQEHLVDTTDNTSEEISDDTSDAPENPTDDAPEDTPEVTTVSAPVNDTSDLTEGTASEFWSVFRGDIDVPTDLDEESVDITDESDEYTIEPTEEDSSEESDEKDDTSSNEYSESETDQHSEDHNGEDTAPSSEEEELDALDDDGFQAPENIPDDSDNSTYNMFQRLLNNQN